MKSGAGCGVIRPYGYRAVRRVSAESRESSAPRSRRNVESPFTSRIADLQSRARSWPQISSPCFPRLGYILVSLGVTMCAPGAYFLARAMLPFAYLYTHRATGHRVHKFDRLASLDPSNVSHFPTPPRAPAAHALPAVLRLSVCSHVHIAPLSAPARALSSHVHL